MPRRVVPVLAVVLAAVLGAVVPQTAASAALTPESTIGTLAGDGQARYGGDGGPAEQASLDKPRGQLATGPDGSIFVADTFNNRIRRIAPDGTISTVAGTGVAGSAGDGRPAASAQLRWPHDVDVDAEGNVYIADAANHRIRMVTPDGIIRTVVGTGVGGFNGDGLAGPATLVFRPKAVVATSSFLWFSDGDNNRVRVLDRVRGVVRTVAGTGVKGYSGDGGRATSARISAPRAIALDSIGNLYFADSQNHRIRRVGLDGIIRTVAGTGVAGFRGDGAAATRALLDQPRGLAVADDATLYVADSDNSRVRRVDLRTGIISTVVGNGLRRYAGDGGAAVRASLYNPRGVTVDRQGRLLISDTLNNRIRVVGP
jgi:sugar lactone lactonase YvrE